MYLILYILLVFSTIGGDSLGDISDFSTIVAALERTSKGFSDSTISPRPGIDVIPRKNIHNIYIIQNIKVLFIDSSIEIVL